MKILVVNGLYRQGHLFTKEVCGEYKRRFDPKDSELQTYQIQNPTTNDNFPIPQKTLSEIEKLLENHHPEILIDFQTTGGDTSELRLRVEAYRPLVQDQLDQYIADLKAKDAPDWLTELGRKKILDTYDEMIKMYTSPLSYFFLNPETNPELANHFNRQKNGAFNVMETIPKKRTFEEQTLQILPFFRVAKMRRISYIYAAATLDDFGDAVEKSDHESEAFRTSIEFIRRIHEYVTRKTN